MPSWLSETTTEEKSSLLCCFAVSSSTESNCSIAFDIIIPIDANLFDFRSILLYFKIFFLVGKTKRWVCGCSHYHRECSLYPHQYIYRVKWHCILCNKNFKKVDKEKNVDDGNMKQHRGKIFETWNCKNNALKNVTTTKQQQCTLSHWYLYRFFSSFFSFHF